MSSKRLFIVMPNWNGRWHLEYSLPSLASATCSSVTFVLIDDGFTDESLDYVASNFPFVKVLHTPPRSGFAAVNTGIRWAAARGAEYVAVANTDIRVPPGLFEPVIAVMEKNPRIAIAGFVELSREHGGALAMPGTVVFRDVGSRLPGMLYVCRLALFQEVGLYDEQYVMYGEENDLFARAARAGYRIVQTNIPVWHYGGGSASQARFRTAWLSYRNAIRYAFKNGGPIEILRHVAVTLDYATIVRARCREQAEQFRSASQRFRPGPSALNLLLWGAALSWNIAALPRTLLARRRVPERLLRCAPSRANNAKTEDADLWSCVDRCPACGARAKGLLFDHVRDLMLTTPEAAAALFRCHNCRSVYLSPRPPPEALSVFYPTGYLPASCHPTTARRPILHSLRSAFKAAALIPYRLRFGSPGTTFSPFGTRRLLEIGCGKGEYLAAMHALGWEVWGCDLDAEKVERARSALGVSTIRAGAFQQLEFPEGYFDAVVLWSVIEHFHEPAAELLRVNRLLRAGGRVVIGTRNPLSAAARLFGRYWAGWDVPRHLVIFSPKGLVDMLRTRGFRVDRVRPSAWMSGFPDSLAFLLRGRLGCGVWGGRIHRLLYYLFFPLVSLSIAAGNWEVLEVTAVKVRDIGDQDILTNELERTARTG